MAIGAVGVIEAPLSPVFCSSQLVFVQLKHRQVLVMLSEKLAQDLPIFLSLLQHVIGHVHHSLLEFVLDVINGITLLANLVILQFVLHILFHLQFLHHGGLQLLCQPPELGFLFLAQLLSFVYVTVILACLLDRTDLPLVVRRRRNVPLAAIELHEMVSILQNGLVGEEA